MAATAASARRVLKDQIAFTPQQVLLEDQGGQKRMRVEGIFSQSDKMTGNKRRYGRPIWEKHVGDRGSDFMKRVQEKKVVGMLEHPEGEPSLREASHLFEDVKLQAGGDVWGRVLVLRTPAGQILEELFSVGVPVGVSSRGEGSTVPADDGCEDVEEDFELDSWDFVHTPALESARARPVEESLQRTEKRGERTMAAVEKARSFLANHPKVAGYDLSKLTEAHIELLGALHGLAAATESEAVELRGRLVEFSRTIADLIGEKSKSDGDKLAEEFNRQYPKGVDAMTALIEELVRRNEKLSTDLKEVQDTGDPKLREELDVVKKKLDAAFRCGEDLVKRVKKSESERQKIEKKYAVSIDVLTRIVERVRSKDLHKQVEALIKKVPQLSKVESNLLSSKTSKQLLEKADAFMSLVESGADKKKPGPVQREPLPPKGVKKGGGLRETKGGGRDKPKSFFARLAERDRRGRGE